MKCSSITLIVCLFCMAGQSPANLWTGAGSDDLWTNPDNWSQGIVPINATSHPGSGWDDPASPFYPLTPDTSDDGPLWNNDAKLQEDGTVTLIDDSVTAFAYGVRVGNGGANNVLQVTGGQLNIGGSSAGGDPAAWHLQVGRGYPGFDGGPVNIDPTATVLMSGGEINVNGLLIPEQFVDNSLPDPTNSAPLNGELVMSGGTINARWMNLGQLKGNGSAELSGDAVIHLWPNLVGQRNNGGHLSFNRDWFLFGSPVPSTGEVSFDVRDDAIVYIFGNESETANTPNLSELQRYQGYIDEGELTANGGVDEPILTLQPCPAAPDPLAELCVNDGGMMITITAPQVVTPGDFDGNGTYECADVDSLVNEIVAGTNTISFDLTGDALVDVDDLNAWLGFAGTALGLPGPILPADANLDGSVNGQDFVRWNNFKFTSGNGFCGGDFNADGFTNGQDFVTWNTFKFQDSDVQAVPEPHRWLMLVGSSWMFAALRMLEKKSEVVECG
jgi:hypothetical protein